MEFLTSIITEIKGINKMIPSLVEILPTEDLAILCLRFEDLVVKLDLNTHFITLSPIITYLNLAHNDKQMKEEKKKFLKNAAPILAKLLQDDLGKGFYEDEDGGEIFVHPSLLFSYEDVGPSSKEKIILIAAYSYTCSQMIRSMENKSTTFMRKRIRSLNERIRGYKCKDILQSFPGQANEDRQQILKLMRPDTVRKLIFSADIEVAVYRWLLHRHEEETAEVAEEEDQKDDEEDDEGRDYSSLFSIETDKLFGNVHQLYQGGYAVVMPSGDRFYSPTAMKPVHSVFRYLTFGFSGTNFNFTDYYKLFFPSKKTSKLSASDMKHIRSEIVNMKIRDIGWTIGCIVK